MPHIYKYFGTKIRAPAFGDLEILSDLGRDIHTYVYFKMIFLGFLGIKGSRKEIFSILGPIVCRKILF